MKFCDNVDEVWICETVRGDMVGRGKVLQTMRFPADKNSVILWGWNVWQRVLGGSRSRKDRRPDPEQARPSFLESPCDVILRLT